MVCTSRFTRPRLTFFHADFGKEFLSRTFWRGPSRNWPSPSFALCTLLYRTEHFSRGRKGRKGGEKRGGRGEKRGGRGVASKGGKKETRTRENRSATKKRKKREKHVIKHSFHLVEEFSETPQTRGNTINRNFKQKKKPKKTIWTKQMSAYFWENLVNFPNFCS